MRFAGREDRPEQRVGANETLAASYFQSIGPGGVHGFTTQVRTGDDVYLEVDELA